MHVWQAVSSTKLACWLVFPYPLKPLWFYCVQVSQKNEVLGYVFAGCHIQGD